MTGLHLFQKAFESESFGRDTLQRSIEAWHDLSNDVKQDWLRRAAGRRAVSRCSLSALDTFLEDTDCQVPGGCWGLGTEGGTWPLDRDVVAQACAGKGGFERCCQAWRGEDRLKSVLCAAPEFPDTVAARRMCDGGVCLGQLEEMGPDIVEAHASVLRMLKLIARHYGQEDVVANSPGLILEVNSGDSSEFVVLGQHSKGADFTATFLAMEVDGDLLDMEFTPPAIEMEGDLLDMVFPRPFRLRHTQRGLGAG